MRGLTVSVYDPSPGTGSSFAAAGMLAPVAVAGMVAVVLILMVLSMMIKVEVEDPTLPLLVKIVNMYHMKK